MKNLSNDFNDNLNNMIKKISVVLIVLFFMLFSGCSMSDGLTSGWFQGGSSSNPGGKIPDVDTSGKGLEVKFNIDDTWISTKRLDYTITLKNTGLSEVKLSEENIRLATSEQDNEGGVFTSESLNSFKKSIIEDSSLILHHDESREDISGSLFITDSYFDEKTHEALNYVLDIDYDYETIFSNNLEFDMESKEIMRVLDKVGQAAPVNINKIELTPYVGEEYILNYYFVDNGPSGSGEISIKISKSDIDLIFRQKALSTNACKILTKKNDEYVELESENIILNKENREMILGCKVNLGDIEKGDIITTATSGSFKYEYNLNFKGRIAMPKTRGENIDWG